MPYEQTFAFLRKAIFPYTKIISSEESDIFGIEKYLLKYRIAPSDALHLTIMEKEGIVQIASEDVEFDMVSEVRRIWFSKNLTGNKNGSTADGSKL